MRIPGAKTAKTLSRWVQARMLGGAVILGYHRVANVPQDEYDNCVSPENFAEHMELLARHARPLPLAKLIDHLKLGSLPSKTVAVTFDDGYADNLHEAKLVLERYQIPATIFITTGYAGREFWWDELERLVKSSQVEVGSLRLQVGESPFVWEPPNGRPDADKEVRRQLQRALYHFLLGLDPQAQSHAMEVIRNWSGASADASAPRALTHAELRQLTEGGLIDLGSHTHHHPMLPRLTLENQKAEIFTGKKELETVLGQPVQGFAYPNGRATDAAKQFVQEAGFAYACTSLPDVVRPTGDMFALTRFWQKNVRGEKFLQDLRLWMKD